jgi:hypothetical protein
MGGVRVLVMVVAGWNVECAFLTRALGDRPATTTSQLPSRSSDRDSRLENFNNSDIALLIPHTPFVSPRIHLMQSIRLI